ncbi:MAG: tRNA lysidine(34) synthetase TilS [Actinomycetota bacterium]|jgi:tRNA(Ile)-lysidine synthase
MAMADEADRLTASLLDRCTFPPPGTDVTCAVSGGADSLALLVLAVSAGCDVTVVHVDHQLRPDSSADARVVERAAVRFGVPVEIHRVRVIDGPNLEARARTARYRVLPADVLTGHTADDQAETVLLNVLRGAAIDGLAGIRASRRPLLGLRRFDTRRLCSAHGLEVVHDQTNDDPRFARNRVRHELLPLISDIARRDPVPILARQASLLADDAEALDRLAAELDPTDARSLAAAPRALARRAVRRWLWTVDPEVPRFGHPPDAATVDRVLDVASGRHRGCDVGGGRRVERHRQRLVLSERVEGR